MLCGINDTCCAKVLSQINFTVSEFESEYLNPFSTAGNFMFRRTGFNSIAVGVETF